MPRFQYQKTFSNRVLTRLEYKADRRYKQPIQLNEVTDFVNGIKANHPNKKIQLTIHSDLNKYRSTKLKSTAETLEWTNDYGSNFFSNDFGKIQRFYIIIK